MDSPAGDPGVRERLDYYESQLGSEDVSRRWRAVEALTRLGGNPAVELIISALNDPDWRVRQKAAWALGEIGDSRAIAPLRTMIRGEGDGVREMIMEALDRISRRSEGLPEKPPR
jgi:HEAT repeat protein